jgi:hypothetical protein
VIPAQPSVVCCPLSGEAVSKPVPITTVRSASTLSPYAAFPNSVTHLHLDTMKHEELDGKKVSDVIMVLLHYSIAAEREGRYVFI